MTDETISPQGRQAMQCAIAAVTASLLDVPGESLGQMSVRQLSLEVASLIAIVRLLVEELSRETGKDAAAIWHTFALTSAASLDEENDDSR